MNEQGIIAMIDAEIARLEQVRKLLGSASTINAGIVRKGRKKASALGTGKPARKKRVLSPEARKRIADAQKKRWAKTKKLADLSAASKKAAKRTAKKAAAKKAAAKNTEPAKGEGSSAVPF